MNKRISKLFLTIIILLLSISACEGNENAYKFIECPVPRLEWNMTREEVWEVLSASTACTEEEFADAKARFDSGETYMMIPHSMFSWEDTGLFGLDFSYFEHGQMDVVHLEFYETEDGKQYLAKVIVNLRAKDEAELRSALTAAFGDPFCRRTGEVGTPEGEMDLYDHLALDWVSMDPQKVISEEEANSYLEKGMMIGRIWTPAAGDLYYAYRLQPMVQNSMPVNHCHLLGVDGCNGYFVVFNAMNYVQTLHLENN